MEIARTPKENDTGSSETVDNSSCGVTVLVSIACR